MLTLTLSLCSFKQYPTIHENTSLTAGPYPPFCVLHSIHPLSCMIRPSMKPSHNAFPKMYSSSSYSSRFSFLQISRSEIPEYERKRRQMPVLITLWRRRTMSVYILPPSNRIVSRGWPGDGIEKEKDIRTLGRFNRNCLVFALGRLHSGVRVTASSEGHPFGCHSPASIPDRHGILQYVDVGTSIACLHTAEATT